MQDGKFAIVENKIIKMSNGEVIPEEEPIIIMRGRDHLALAVLNFYYDISVSDGCTGYQLEGVKGRIKAFEDFKAKYPERMKQPGITEGK